MKTGAEIFEAYHQQGDRSGKIHSYAQELSTYRAHAGSQGKE